MVNKTIILSLPVTRKKPRAENNRGTYTSGTTNAAHILNFAYSVKAMYSISICSSPVSLIVKNADILPQL
jgi:hypothetical protein